MDSRWLRYTDNICTFLPASTTQRVITMYLALTILFVFAYILLSV